MHWPPPRSLRDILATFFACLLGVLPSGLDAQEPTEIVFDMKAIPGLRYDLARIKVAPGAKVRLRLENADDMAHNLVITAPGARLEVANAAMTMPLTPAQDFVPKTEKVLHAIPVLPPGKKAELVFTAPEKEDVYPYVCTYPGHGMVMFGALYVTRKELPPLEKDPHVPDSAKEFAGQAPLHAHIPTRPYLYRMFLRDSGPASIAVALPGEQNYCWDAGACRLRYAWRGAFLDPLPYWRDKGDAFAEVKGRIYWRAGAEFPLRIGDKDKLPTVKFRGYRLIARHPEFHYEVDGVEVRELIKAPHHGSGLETTFKIASNAPVFLVSGPAGGATFASSAGMFKDGMLTLTAEQARGFTITMTEIPGREPIGYWSMDDVLSVKKPFPIPGVKGRALTFDGKKAEHATGLNTNSLKEGATFSLWIKAQRAEGRPALTQAQVVLGARGETQEFSLGWLNGFPRAFGMLVRDAQGQAELMAAPDVGAAWHHVAVTIRDQEAVLFYDGQRIGQLKATLPDNAQLFLGSLGGSHFAAATLDEARIYDRVLSEAEIRELYQSVHAQALPIPEP